MTTWICALFVLLMLISVFVFALLHIIAQLLRHEQQNLVKDAEGQEEEELGLSGSVRFSVPWCGMQDLEAVATIQMFNTS